MTNFFWLSWFEGRVWRTVVWLFLSKYPLPEALGRQQHSGFTKEKRLQSDLAHIFLTLFILYFLKSRTVHEKVHCWFWITSKYEIAKILVYWFLLKNYGIPLLFLNLGVRKHSTCSQCIFNEVLHEFSVCRYFSMCQNENRKNWD